MLPFKHNPGCPRSDATPKPFQGRRGDTLLRCKACGSMQVVVPKEPDLPEPPAGVTFTHRTDCPEAQLHQFTGRTGEQVLRCRACGRSQPLPSAAAPQPGADASTAMDEGTAEADTAPPEPIRGLPKGTRWVCRDHLSQPVNWRGNGCRRCKQPPKKTSPEPNTDLNY